MKKQLNISQIIPVAMLIILVIAGAVLSNSFLTVTNFSNILQYAVESGFIGIGMAFVLFIGGIDLSVGSVMAFASVVAARLAIDHVSVLLILLVVLAIGIGCGMANGLLITKLKVEAFMATLAVMMIMRACTYLFTGGGPITGSSVDGSFKAIIKAEVFGIPIGVIYVIAAFVIAWLIATKTRFGRHVYAVGGGEETAKLFGVRVDRIKITVYVISGVLAAISGMLVAARIGIGEPRTGYDYEMTAITVCVVGGVSMTGGKGSMIGTFIGLMVVSMIKNLMNLMNFDVNGQPIVTGIIILITTLIVSREIGNRRKKLIKDI
ncbi:MAG: ABC transporter permease [Candidatus Alectryocaccobium sp.]|jgi:ribose transport system permease protein